MSKKFIMVLTKHSTMGVLLKPYLVEAVDDKSYSIVNNILSENIEPNNYSDEQNQLIKWTLQCSEQEVCRVFAREKNTVVEFFSQLKKNDKQLEYVHEYIEKRLLKCFNILYNSDIELYFGSDSDNISKYDRIIIEKEQPQVIFNFTKDNTGLKYHLTIKHKGEYINLYNSKFTVINNSPCIIIIENKAYFFSLDEDFDAKKLLPFFQKTHIEIPQRVEEQYFKTFIKKSIQNFEVVAKGFEIEVQKHEPKAILNLEKDWRDEFVLILKFEYSDKQISANNPIKSFVYFDDKSKHFTKIERNFKFEQEKINILNNFNELKEDINNIYKINSEFYNQEFDLLTWLNSNSYLLVDYGFTINQSFYKKQYFIEDIRLELNLKEQKDWFNLYGLVHFGKYKFPFILLKKHLINGIKEYVLPNQEIAILPDEWFEKYSHVFKMAKVKDDNLQIKKIHLHYVEDTLEEIDKNKIIKANKLPQLKPSKPADLKADLREYQQVGYNWLYTLYKSNFGACLADDMGLGKTLQTLSVILKIIENKSSNTAVAQNKQPKNVQLSLFDNLFDDNNSNEAQNAGIIIMPSSLIHNWANEINKFAPKIKYLRYSSANSTKYIKDFNYYDIILTSYGLLRNNIEFLSNYYYKFVILDESQFIKNPESKTYNAVNELNAEFRMILTGTPIENSLTDLWTQLNFINPGLLGDLKFFKKEFIYPITKSKDKDEQALKKDRLKKLISPFILRRKKDEVLSDLPDLTEAIIHCEMSELQKKLYEKENSKIRNALFKSSEKQDIAEYNMIVLQGLLRLRQLANHISLMPVSDDEQSLTEENLQASSSGKYDEVLWTLENLVAENNKVLIFSSFVKHLNIYAEYFEHRNWKYSKLTGQTKNREQEIHSFNNNDDTLLFLISLKAGGVGLNLTSANYVLFLDPWWNPAVENQAIARAHRIGQKNKVTVYRFITENSIEQKIIKLQESKKELADTFINDNNPLKQLSQEEILGLFM